MHKGPGEQLSAYEHTALAEDLGPIPAAQGSLYLQLRGNPIL